MHILFIMILGFLVTFYIICDSFLSGLLWKQNFCIKVDILKHKNPCRLTIFSINGCHLIILQTIHICKSMSVYICVWWIIRLSVRFGLLASKESPWLCGLNAVGRITAFAGLAALWDLLSLGRCVVHCSRRLIAHIKLFLTHTLAQTWIVNICLYLPAVS